MSHRHCTEYARAGAGLPHVERGMPTPAGTGLSRRSFLLRSAGVALSVYGGGRLLPQELTEGIAAAAAAGPQPILVNVLMSGGLDSIGILGPYGSGRLADLRPQLADPGRPPLPYRDDNAWSWHPDAAALDRLHRANRLTVIPSIGYADANQSHFTSRHFWEIGATDLQVRTGWMGRYLDQPGVGDPLNPVQGLTLGQSLVPSLAAGTMPVAAVETPSAYVFRAPGVWEEEVEPAMHGALAQLATTPSAGDPVLTQAKSAQANASNLQSQLSTLPATAGPTYPDTQFGSRLRTLAHMIDEGLPIRVAGLIANGDYDTHAGQASGFADHLPKALGALETFQADLEARGLADRVLTVVWSEFGRRPEQNGSAGTDHGAAGIGFVLGRRAAGGQVGAFSDIGAGKLDEDGNLVHDVDFRDVYGTLLERWLGADAERIVTGPGGRAVRTDLPLVAA